MIKIQAYLSNGEMKIQAVGHAGYAEHGKDIVCASVSTIMQTALLGLQAVAEQYPDYIALEIREEGEMVNEEV